MKKNQQEGGGKTSDKKSGQCRTPY